MFAFRYVWCRSCVIGLLWGLAPTPVSGETIGLTYYRPDGNRLVDGKTDLASIEPRDLSLDGRPDWVVAIPDADGILWAVVLEDGRVQAFKVEGNATSNVDLLPNSLPPGMPPVLYIEDDIPKLLSPPETASRLTHPALINQYQDMAYIDQEGDLVVTQEGGFTSLPVNALPDARILVDEQDRLLFLSGPTGSYAHGVLGDRLEAQSVTLVATRPTPRILNTISMLGSWVIEGIAPIWVDMNQDGTREIIVTQSRSGEGAQIVIYDESGRLVATGPSIGLSFRWRHQIAAAPFGPSGEIELVDVKTPHIGGIVEFFRWERDRLNIIHSNRGFTSHVMGTRNLDLAVGGRFTGTDQPVLLLPVQDRTALAAIRHGSSGAEQVLSLPLDGTLATNLAATTLDDGRLAVGVGRNDNTLRIWQPFDVLPKLTAIWLKNSNEIVISLNGFEDVHYKIQLSSNLRHWTTAATVKFIPNLRVAQIRPQGNRSLFFRAVSQENIPEQEAQVTAVSVSGSENSYRFSVQISSPDTGCDQFADWWEVLDESGHLLYRRILLHSHVNEQPFTRSGGPIKVGKDQTVYVRAHMNSTGYGTTVFKGSVQDGFIKQQLDGTFAAEVSILPPQPSGCEF